MHLIAAFLFFAGLQSGVTFSTDAAEGSYRITLKIGDPATACETTVKAEARRLMIERLKTAPGQMETQTILVSVRYRELPGGGEVKLKPRELNHPDWDHRLSLEFSGLHPCVAGVDIAKDDRSPVIYLAGDSTVVDDDGVPFTGWGQMIPRFFKPPGDYLFIQFGHNDQKLLKRFITETRSHDATRVLVTSMVRRSFDGAGRIVNTLDDYPQTMRDVARDENVALIDLNAMSQAFFEDLGPEASKKAYVHFPAGTFPNHPEELSDDTHFNEHGAYELARRVTGAIRRSGLPLAQFVTGDEP